MATSSLNASVRLLHARVRNSNASLNTHVKLAGTRVQGRSCRFDETLLSRASRSICISAKLVESESVTDSHSGDERNSNSHLKGFTANIQLPDHEVEDMISPEFSPTPILLAPVNPDYEASSKQSAFIVISGVVGFLTSIFVGLNFGKVWGLSGLAGLLAFLSRVRLINASEEALLESLGVYQAKLPAGLYFLKPVVDSLVYRYTLREKVLDIRPQQCITRDNAPISADAVVYWRIFDGKLAYYAVEDLEIAIQNLVLTQLRTEIGRLTLDETFSARATLNNRLLAQLDEATDAWGVKVTRVEVRDILPDRAIMSALEMQMTAERSKRALVLESEGRQLSQVNIANGEAQSQIIEARATSEAEIIAAKAEAEVMIVRAEAEKASKLLEAEAVSEAITEISHKTGLSTEEASNIYLSKVHFDTNKEIGTSSNTKVMFVEPGSIPAAIQSLLSLGKIDESAGQDK